MSTKPILKIGIFIFMAVFVWTTTVYCLPEVKEVVSGDAQVQYPDSNTLKIDATNGTIINYTSFDIMENESVIISLPSQDSQILNRVIEPTQSRLLGDLDCNGIFILINRAGIYVGPSANINTNIEDPGSVILSTRNITDSDFLAGNYLFKKLSPEEVDRLLVNKGKIIARKAGFAVFIAGAIDNDGTIIAPLGKVVLASGDAVRLDISGGGLISVAIEEEVASTILDYEDKPVTDQIKNTGTLEANGGAVILKAESLPDIFEKAINLEGFGRAVKAENKDGVIKLVADGDVKIDAELEATHIEIGDPEEGMPENLHIEGTMHAREYGNIHIDCSKTLTLLGTIKTDYGYIKIGSRVTPTKIEGEPHYVHTQGDFKITQVEENEDITTLHTERGDTLLHSTTGSVTLEALSGSIIDITHSHIPAAHLTLIGNTFDINSAAITTHLFKNNGDIYISDSSVEEDLVTIEGEGFGRVLYISSNNIILETNNDVNTAAGVILTGNMVKIISRKTGTIDIPVTINANITYIKRLQGNIDILSSLGIGTSILMRGPPGGEIKCL